MTKYEKYNQSEKGKQRDKQYRQSEKGKEARRRYRQTKGKHITSARYLSKPFIAIGGQGIKTNDPTKIIYSHLALSTGKSITDENGLTTDNIFRFIFDNTPKNGEAILVSYGSAYDFNNWLRDVTHDQLKELYGSNYRTKPINVGMWSLKFSVGQFLTIYDLWGESITINDCYNFFQVPLNVSAKEYLNLKTRAGGKYDKAVYPNELIKGAMELQIELKATAELMTEFRRRLEKVNLRPRRWCGSGSITQTLFERNKIKEHKANHPEDIQKIIRYAYAGGRFEMCHYGTVKKRRSYAYDINSAYPEALTKLPSLAGGRWLHIDGDGGDVDYGLYKIRITAKKSRLPHPLFTRDIRGSISYPRELEGWFWSPEIKMVRKWAERGFGTYEIDQCFLFEPKTDIKPFAFIGDLYQKRLELQQAGDEAEIGLKLALNSAYGKLAQQVGYLPKDGRDPEKIPAYHQLDWAGFVTSYTRAKIYETAIEHIHNVIAFETDAVYMGQELYNLPIGDQLGEFRETVYSELSYINSGIYFGVKENGERVFKMRGLQSGTVSLEELEKLLDKPETGRKMEIKQKRFVSGATAVLTNDLGNWLSWREEKLDLKLYPVGKRTHYLCSCNDEETGTLTKEFWHETTPTKPYKQMVQYCVEWINPEPAQILTRQTNKIDKEGLV